MPAVGPPPSGLPIDAVLPALRAALRERDAAVLVAAPGAGKSTVVPLTLLGEPWRHGRKLLVLEPRRVAARAVAQRMSHTLGEAVGGTVGYRMRMETRVGPRTAIEVVTEGVLTRMLQHDAALEGVAAVLFDEFHERSLQADLGLALCLDARRNLGTDLKLLVMSATLEAGPVAQLLGDAPVVESSGRSFEVVTHHIGSGLPLLPGAGERIEPPLARAILRALREESDGDVLVFLPGAGEIRALQRTLADSDGAAGVRVLPLYGELAAGEQDAALADAQGGQRRVILATNIAETSLTIAGVRVVVDSGLVRRARFDPATGMGRLEVQRISRASADQRRGRAGRTAPGVCYRLWSAGAERSLAARTPPEIEDADLAPLALDMAAWGARDAAALPFLDAPPAAMLDAARSLLLRLGALGHDGRISAHGRELAGIAAHPRLAHMLLRSRATGRLRAASDIAGLLGERDLLRNLPGAAHDCDVDTRLAALRGAATPGSEVDRGAVQRARQAADRFARMLGDGAPAAAHARRDDATGVLLATAYPDRIARRRAGTEARFLLANGRGAAFPYPDRLAKREFLVAVALDDREREARIQLAAALDRADIDEAVGDRIETVDEVEWSTRENAVAARRVERLDALVLSERTLAPPPAERALAAMLDGIRLMGIGALPWSDELRQWQARVALARAQALPEAAHWPDCSDSALLADVDSWAAPWLAGITRAGQLERLPLAQMLDARLGAGPARELDRLLPTHIELPTGTRTRVDYLDDLAPCASMRMQEVFGLALTPRIGGGRIPVTFKLLSPAQRPLQVTRDLASFWRNAYSEVRKEMRGRYPRHYWPEDPLAAEPRRGIARRTRH
jgi:ATP-dependent helicase HrpB